MIKSINSAITEDTIERIRIEALDEREENFCLADACGAAARPCVGQACWIACFGVTVCLLGLHTL